MGLRPALVSKLNVEYRRIGRAMFIWCSNETYSLVRAFVEPDAGVPVGPRHEPPGPSRWAPWAEDQWKPGWSCPVTTNGQGALGHLGTATWKRTNEMLVCGGKRRLPGISTVYHGV